MSHLSREVIKKIKEERESIKINSKLEHNSVCELIYSNLVDCLTSNHIKSSRVVSIPNLKYNKSIYLKDCFDYNSNMQNLKNEIDISYYVPSSGSYMYNNEKIKIEYDFSNNNYISCKVDSR
jgi:hypothetical protein